MTGVASFILLADVGDQRLRTLHLNFEGGDQRVFGVNDNVSRFPLKFKANRKLHLCALPISVKSSTIQLGGVKLIDCCRQLRSNLDDWAEIRRVAGVMLGRCSGITPNEPDFGMNEEEIARYWRQRSGIPWLGRADIGHDTNNKIVPFGVQKRMV